MHVLSIGYGRTLFKATDPERGRMEACAKKVESLHMVVFSLESDGLEITRAGENLTLYPTNSKSRMHMLMDAVRIGIGIVRGAGKAFVLTSQDPFEAGLAGWIIASRLRLPFCVQVHGDFFSSGFWRRSRLSNRLRYLLGLFILRRADTVRVVSRRIEATMRRLGIPEERLAYLPVRSDAIAAEDEAVDLHAAYPDASTIVLFLGRLVPEKNLPLLLSAFAELYRADPRALLLIIGDGPERERVAAVIAKEGIGNNVVLLPWTDRPFGYMRGADICALSSDWEGWGRVLIEAMAAGTPAITTDVGCAGEVFKDGEHGFVVGIRDLRGFSSRLIALAADPALRESMGRAGTDAWQKLALTREAYAESWAAVWEKTASLHISH